MANRNRISQRFVLKIGSYIFLNIFVAVFYYSEKSYSQEFAPSSKARISYPQVNEEENGEDVVGEVIDIGKITRLNNSKPIIYEKMFTDLGASKREGSNINGPSVIRIPDWIHLKDRVDPTAKYYCYFAHHSGHYIRMAWAAQIEGPWKLYQVGSSVEVGDRGVLDMGVEVKNNNRKGITLDNKVTGSKIIIDGSHIASPDAHVDNVNKRIVLYFHSGGPTIVGETRVNKQLTFVATSRFGLNFRDNIKPEILGGSYFRVFEYDNQIYGISNSGYLSRAPNPLNPWQSRKGHGVSDENINGLWKKNPKNPNPLQRYISDLGYSRDELRVRHLSVRIIDDELQVFYSRRGEIQERILMSTIDLNVDDGDEDPKNDWDKWDVNSPPIEILKAKHDWEGGDLIPKRSIKGPVLKKSNQLRDPYIFEDTDGSTYLFYVGGGEKAIGVARIE